MIFWAKLIPNHYLEPLKNRNFLILNVLTFLGQMATGFLLLALLISAFLKTRSSLGVSGVLVSFSISGFLIIAFAGLLADLYDRRKIILYTNIFITLVVLLIVVVNKAIFASIPLSLLYFGGNTFFLPAASAASSQLVPKKHLSVANSLFIVNLGAGVIAGVFLAAVFSLFVESLTTLILAAVLLLFAALLSYFLPSMPPTTQKGVHRFLKLKDILLTFKYIAEDKLILFSFVMFALSQTLIIVALTITPGFFDQVVGLSVDKSPIFILPFIGIGAVVGLLLISKPRFNEFKYMSYGILLIGASILALGFTVLSQLISGLWLLIPMTFFLVFVALGDTLFLISARSIVQKRVSHAYHGTIFAANIMLSSFLSGLFSPLVALAQTVFGYVNILIFGGFGFLAFGGMVYWLGKKWKY